MGGSDVRWNGEKESYGRAGLKPAPTESAGMVKKKRAGWDEFNRPSL